MVTPCSRYTLQDFTLKRSKIRLWIAVGYGEENLRLPFNIVSEAFGT